jgi:uncharacterized protein YdcH (DUF465 family)
MGRIKYTIESSQGTSSNEISNIERLMKYCSRLGEIFGYPYYFNWSTSTNHRDHTETGLIQDIKYAIIRVGKYPLENAYISPVENSVIHGPVNLIINSNIHFKSLVEKYELVDKEVDLSTESSIIENLEKIKKAIDMYLDDLIQEAIQKYKSSEYYDLL